MSSVQRVDVRALSLIPKTKPVKEFTHLPDDIRCLDPQALRPGLKKHKQGHSRPALVRNVPGELLAFFSHASGNAVPKLHSPFHDDALSPVFGDDKTFFLSRLWSRLNYAPNLVTTTYRPLTRAWRASVTGVPWRSNEISVLLCLHEFFQDNLRTERRIGLDEVVRYCSRRPILREYLRTVYSLLAIESTRIFIAGCGETNTETFDQIIMRPCPLFTFQGSTDDLNDLAKELCKAGEESGHALMKALAGFEVVFKGQGMEVISALHKYSTPEKPDRWVDRGHEPNYTQQHMLGGQLFHCPHPHTDLDLSFIRGWAFLSAFMPILKSGGGLRKEFSVDAVAAVMGMSKIKDKKPALFRRTLKELSSYWGRIEIDRKGNLSLVYGVSNTLITAHQEKKADLFDLVYGRVNIPDSEFSLRVPRVPADRMNALLWKALALGRPLTGNEVAEEVGEAAALELHEARHAELQTGEPMPRYTAAKIDKSLNSNKNDKTSKKRISLPQNVQKEDIPPPQNVQKEDIPPPQNVQKEDISGTPSSDCTENSSLDSWKKDSCEERDRCLRAPETTRIKTEDPTLGEAKAELLVLLKTGPEWLQRRMEPELAAVTRKWELDYLTRDIRHWLDGTKSQRRQDRLAG